MKNCWKNVLSRWASKSADSGWRSLGRVPMAWWLVGLLILAVCVGAWHRSSWIGVGPVGVASAAEAEEQDAGGPPALEIDKDAPLLLLDEPEPKKKSSTSEMAADNSMCLCCHLNYEEEFLVTTHAAEGIGCIKCHGECLAHRDDEDNITPPDIMYWPERIDPACQKCHDMHDAPARDVIARWQERCPAKTDPESLVCTDCHGSHRLKFRTVWWNKKTGELIVREKGQIVKPKKNLTEPSADDAGEALLPADQQM